MEQATFDRSSELANVLQAFCREGRSGVLHIVTGDSHTALFGLMAGEIVTVRYRIRKGAKALEQMLGISSGRYRFEEGAAVEPGSPLPDTDDILARLGVTKQDSSAPTPAPQAPKLEPDKQLSSSAQATLSQILANYTGPVASLLTRSVFANTSDPSEAIAQLAEKIPNPTQARAFTDEASAKLKDFL